MYSNTEAAILAARLSHRELVLRDFVCLVGLDPTSEVFILNSMKIHPCEVSGGWCGERGQLRCEGMKCP